MNTIETNPGLPTSSPPATGAWAGHLVTRLTKLLRDVATRLNGSLPKDGSEAMTGPLRLATYLAAGVPAAADHAGAVIYVSDGAAGQKFRGSDGAAWVNLG